MRAIDPPLNTLEREALIAAGRALRDAGTRFRHQGRSERGVDCGGLLAYCLRAAGREPNDVLGYARTPYKDSLRDVMIDNFGEPIPKSEMREGDAVLLRFQGEPCHVGIVTDYPTGGFALLHAYAVYKKVVEHRMDALWMSYITDVFRL